MRRIYKISLSLLILVVVGVSASSTYAHLEGEAIEKDGYRIELGQVPQSAVAGENVTFSLSMENLEGERISDIKAWVRLSLGDLILFSSTDFITDKGTIDFSATFMEPGDHEMLTRVVDIVNAKEVTVTFKVKVNPDPNAVVEVVPEDKNGANSGIALATLLIGLAGGAFLGMVFHRRKAVK